MAKNFPGWLSWVVLISGVLYLLADLKIFDWGINWWTVALIFFGLWGLFSK